MREIYVLSIDRPGLADLPELVRTDEPEIAGDIVRSLLSARDSGISRVVVTVQRVVDVTPQPAALPRARGRPQRTQSPADTDS